MSACKPNPSLIIITPSCLRVDKAIIFFKSVSAVALTPAISIVRLAKIRVVGQNQAVVLK